MHNIYKYQTTVHRSSFDVINILAILFIEHHLKKTHCQRGDLNLRRYQYEVNGRDSSC